jgi:hypothetical protein
VSQDDTASSTVDSAVRTSPGSCLIDMPRHSIIPQLRRDPQSPRAHKSVQYKADNELNITGVSQARAAYTPVDCISHISPSSRPIGSPRYGITPQHCRYPSNPRACDSDQYHDDCECHFTAVSQADNALSTVNLAARISPFSHSISAPL